MDMITLIQKKTNTLLIGTPLFFWGLKILVLTATLFMGCGADDLLPVDKGDECNNIAHDNYRALVQGSTTRDYLLHIPVSYDGTTPIPLVINFHGFGDCASAFYENVGEFYGLNALADDENFIVAYPQGVIREKDSPEWDPGDNGSQDISENDVFFTEQLISAISDEFNVDLSRVYATGYSNGGMMAYGLACTRSDLIAAVGIMSGIMLPSDCDVSEHTSVIHFHGIEDEVISYDGSQDFQAIQEVITFWLDHNDIPASNLVTTELSGGDVVRDEYMGGAENTAVVLYTINREFGKPGGHVWFSDEIDGLTPNQILWEFLSSFSL